MRVPTAIASTMLLLFCGVMCDAAQPDACALFVPSAAGRVLGTKATAHAMDTSLAGRNAASMCRY